MNVRCLKFRNRFRSAGLVIHDEIIRSIIHPLHQFIGFLNDGGAVAPGKYGGKQSRDFYILFFAETMRYRNRILRDKGRMIVFKTLSFQENPGVLF